MLIIKNNHTDPYWNLAAEEYLLKHFEQNFFMLWRNSESIIIGRHQNAHAEINLDFVTANQVKVVRRISGGGAVFHDLGNINFTFIQGGHEPKTIDFKTYTLPILEVLNSLGVKAELVGRNDLMVNGLKISGNAEYIHKNRILHHGTLLYSAKMADLSNALRVNPHKYQDKSTKSIRKRVGNISEFLPEPMPVEVFMDKIYHFILTKYEGSTLYEFSGEDRENIQKLADQKYHTWDWTFGPSPNYNFSKTGRTEGGTIEVHLNVEHGIIREARIFGDFFAVHDIATVEKALAGVPHDPGQVKTSLNHLNLDDFLNNVSIHQLVDLMF